MINTLLLASLLLYITSLLIGFSLHNKSKSVLNKRYQKFKPLLTGMISVIFLYSLMITYYGTTMVPGLNYILLANVLFILYFYLLHNKNTRCWKQHRILFYNFFVIVLNYYISLVIGNMYLNFFVFFIIAYTILEFQFAKFSFKQPFIWD